MDRSAAPSALANQSRRGAGAAPVSLPGHNRAARGTGFAKAGRLQLVCGDYEARALCSSPVWTDLRREAPIRHRFHAPGYPQLNVASGCPTAVIRPVGPADGKMSTAPAAYHFKLLTGYVGGADP